MYLKLYTNRALRHCIDIHILVGIVESIQRILHDVSRLSVISVLEYLNFMYSCLNLKNIFGFSENFSEICGEKEQERMSSFVHESIAYRYLDELL